jgi:hypothetical protein
MSEEVFEGEEFGPDFFREMQEQNTRIQEQMESEWDRQKRLAKRYEAGLEREVSDTYDPLLDSEFDEDLCVNVDYRIHELLRYDLGDDIMRLNKYERAVHFFMYAMGIYGNGGLQYVMEGDLLDNPNFRYHLEAFALIGMPMGVGALEGVVSLYEDGGVPEDVDLRLSIFHRVSEEKRDELDERFGAELYEEKLAAFIRANKEQFSRLRDDVAR